MNKRKGILICLIILVIGVTVIGTFKSYTDDPMNKRMTEEKIEELVEKGLVNSSGGSVADIEVAHAIIIQDLINGETSLPEGYNSISLTLANGSYICIDSEYDYYSFEDIKKNIVEFDSLDEIVIYLDGLNIF